MTNMHEIPNAQAVPQWTKGDRMAKALDYAGVSRGEMADYMDVTTETLRKWCHDLAPVRKSTLRLWALRTGVSMEWLESGEVMPDTRRYLHAVNTVLTANRRAIRTWSAIPSAS